MTDRTVFVENYVIHLLAAKYCPELFDRVDALLTERLAHRIHAAGHIPSGPTSRTTWGYRIEREQHHDHGWQYVQVACPIEDAEYQIIYLEQTGVPRGA